MALTPFLNEAGRRAAKFIDDKFDAENVSIYSEIYKFETYIHTDASVHACI